MEYVESGTLHDTIQTSDDMSESTVRHIISQILSALEYMHERVRVSHRDLKPAVPPSSWNAELTVEHSFGQSRGVSHCQDRGSGSREDRGCDEE